MTNPLPHWIHALNQPPSWSFAVLEHPEANPEQRLYACQMLIQSGVVRWTARHVEALRHVPAVAGRAEQLMGLCRTLAEFDLTEGAPIPAVHTPDPRAGNYWMVPNGSRKTLVVFTGRAKRLTVSVYLMQRILEPFQVNVLYLFDPWDAFYLAGIGGSWAGFDATVGLVRRLCDGLDTGTLYCLGQSSGGYGALRYGLELGAQAVLAFSPMIRQVARPRSLERIRAAAGDAITPDALTPDAVDLRRLYQGRPATPRTTIVCGAENIGDMRSAAELSDLPGVAHRPVPGVADHAVITTLLRAGTLRPTIAEFLGA